jgi:hypothetical protein
MTSTETEDGWVVAVTGDVATIRLLRNLDADDAFSLRATVARLVEGGCTGFVFDVHGANYIAHSAQSVIREARKRSAVSMRGISDRLRRTLQSDRIGLLGAVTEEPDTAEG